MTLLTQRVSHTGLSASLQRLQLEYIDVVFANRPDPNTPIEGGCAQRSQLEEDLVGFYNYDTGKSLRLCNDC